MNNKFSTLLMRNNKQLRSERGLLIAKNAEKSFRREVEDLKDRYEQLIADREQLLDINPSNTQIIQNPSDFNQAEFVKEFMKKGLQIREVRIQLEVAEEAYNELFGELPKTEE